MIEIYLIVLEQSSLRGMVGLVYVVAVVRLTAAASVKLRQRDFVCQNMTRS